MPMDVTCINVPICLKQCGMTQQLMRAIDETGKKLNQSLITNSQSKMLIGRFVLNCSDIGYG